MYRIGEWFEQKNDTVTHYVSNYSTTNYKIITIYSYIIKLFVYIAVTAAIILYKKKDENESEVIRITIMSTLEYLLSCYYGKQLLIIRMRHLHL